LTGSPSGEPFSLGEIMEQYSNTVTDSNGAAISGALVYVYDDATTTLSTIYSDNGVTAQTNPITTDANGAFSFYAADGTYDLTVTASNYTQKNLDNITLGANHSISGDLSVTGDLIAPTVSGTTTFNADVTLLSDLDIGGHGTTFTIAGSSFGARAAIHADAVTDVLGYVIERHEDTTAAFGAHFVGARTRGTEAVETIVQSGDMITRFLGMGYDGTDYALAAEMAIEVDGTPGANDMPGRIVFRTTPDGSQTLAEAMRISNDKTVSTQSDLTVGGSMYHDGVAGMSTLRAISPVNGQRAYLAYHTSDGDGGHGWFRGVTGAAAATYTHDNGITVVASGGDGSAAWLREDADKGPCNVKWFGATGDGTTDDTTALTNCYSSANNLGIKSVFHPSGSYYTSSGNLRLYKNTRYYGVGIGSKIFTDTAVTNVFFNDGISTTTYTSRTYYSLSNITAGDNTITFTTASEAANFTAGDLILIRSTAAIVTGQTLPYFCCLEKILAVDSGTGIVTLEEAVNYSVTSPLAGAEDASVNDAWLENTIVDNLYIKANSGTTGAPIRWRGSYKCHIHDCRLDGTQLILGNGFNRTTIENIEGTFIQSLSQLATGSNASVLRNVVAYADAATTTSSTVLLSAGEFTNDIIFENIKIYAPQMSFTNSSGIIYHQTTNGNGNVVRDIIVHASSVTTICKYYGAYYQNTKNYTLENIYVDASVTNGIALDDSAASFTFTGLTIKDINTNSTANTSMLDIASLINTTLIELSNIKSYTSVASTWATNNGSVKVQAWIQYSDSSGVAIGQIPRNVVIENIDIFVTQTFDAGTTNYISVGRSVQTQEYSLNQSVASLGKYSASPNTSKSGYTPTIQYDALIYYTQSGTAATQGKALVTIEYTPIQPSP